MELIVEFNNDELKEILRDQAEKYTYIPAGMEVVGVSISIGDGCIQVITQIQEKEEGEQDAAE